MNLSDDLMKAIEARDIQSFVSHMADRFALPPLNQETLMNEPIKPIETHYAGCRFRSRLEARWAVFFDTLGVAWEYERQGLEVNGKSYLPDFWLPNEQMHIEVKGDASTLNPNLLLELAEGSPDRFRLLVLGPVPEPSSPHLHTLVTNGWYLRMPAHFASVFLIHRNGLLKPVQVHFGTLEPAWPIVEGEPFWPMPPYAEVQAAYTAARSARFEHGERG